MLATFIIGLREGLEAALIVGIIAAFLRNNGKSLTAMWLGVVLAVLLSIAVGATLKVVEQALPQAAQEGMETVIGAIAIFFVTGMIVWMNAHARDMKRQIEAEAAEALGQASAYALAMMAFLAVLKEGFETSVFLLATFSAAQSAALAAAGAIAGLLAAAIVGWGIYIGGVRINLSRFFRFTGAFLILVAAGLVISSLRTAHEAGWLNAGQQTTVDLAWLVAPGTIQSALITGVLGIPARPRLIEAIGWFAYLVPTALVIYWPPSRRPGPRMAARLRLALAAVLALAALGLTTLYPVPRPQLPAEAAIVAADGPERTIGSVRLTTDSDGQQALAISTEGAKDRILALPNDKRHKERHDGIVTSQWSLADTGTPAGSPSTLTLEQVVELSGDRIPVGLNRQRNPGPFAADWSTHREIKAWAAAGVLLDASGHDAPLVTLSGGGLQTPRTLTVEKAASGAPIVDWKVSDAYREQTAAALHRLSAAVTERHFWAVQLPVFLVIVALLLAASAARILIRQRSIPEATTTGPVSKSGRGADSSIKKGVTNAAH